jgi:AcrR family transcriptional regulator
MSQRHGAAASSEGEVQPSRTDGLRMTALAAAIELLTEEGWDAVTQPKVAERSGLGRATIYRYWPDRTALVRDAVATHMRVSRHEPPTGDLRQDLLNEMHDLRYELTERDLGPVLAAVVDRAEWEPEMFRLKLEITEGGTRVIRQLLVDAVARGDLAPDTDVDASISVLVGPLLYRRLISAEAVAADFAEWLVDRYLQAHATKRRRARVASR